MTENQLETFLAIVRYGSYSKAAAVLHLSQPTLSYRIQTLESDLGARLFSHQKFQSVLTPAGEDFLPYARQLCREMEEARRKLRLHTSPRDLVIGFPEMMLQGPCRTFLSIMQLIPATEAVLTSQKLERPPHDVQQLADGQVDLIFTDLGQPALSGHNFEKRRLFDDHCRICLEKSHPLAGCERLTFDQLRGETIFRYDDLTCFTDQVIARLDAKCLAMDETHRHLSYVQMLPVLKKGQGLIITNQQPIPDPDLVYIPLDPEVPMEIGVAWRKGDSPPALRLLVRKLTEMPPEAWA